MDLATGVRHEGGEQRTGWRQRIDGRWHERAMLFFAVVVLAHWAEHVLQAIQIYLLGWPVPEARGALGMVWPWLVTSEWLHFGYAIFMVIGLWLLVGGLAGRARTWWTIALAIQVWHVFEHALLFGQAQAGVFLFGGTAPTSVLQLFVRRPELHLVYNAIVTAPMLLAMVYHLFPSRAERAAVTCTCAVDRATVDAG